MLQQSAENLSEKTIIRKSASPVSTSLGRFTLAVALPLLLLIVAGYFRSASAKKFGIVFDEQLTRAVAENVWKGDLRTDWFYVPHIPDSHHLHCYNFSSYFLANALVSPPGTKNPLYRDRLFAAVCGTLGIALIYVATLFMFGYWEGLAALAIVAVSPLLVQDAHYARPEAFSVLLVGAVYVCCAGILSRWRLNLLLAIGSFCCGLLIACKPSFAPLAAMPLACVLARSAQRVRVALVWAALVLAGTFVGMPDAFIHPQNFLAGIETLRHHYSGEHVPHSLPDSLTCWKLLVPYFWQTGAAFCLLTAAGIMVLLRRRQALLSLILAGPVVFYVAFFGQQRVFFERNLSHVIPMAAMLAGVALVAIINVLPPRPWRPAIFALALLVVVAQPALVSKTLVFQAMRTSTDHRAANYGNTLSQQQRAPLVAAAELLVGGHVDQLVNWANQSRGDILVATRDYHDVYTKRNLAELQKRVKATVVGEFPSLFPGFSTSTLVVYHSPSFRYIRLSPSDNYTNGGQPFVSWKSVSDVIKPGSVNAQSWEEDGVSASAPRLDGGEPMFGSFTRNGGDANRGRLQMAQVALHGQSAFAIPILTGPKQDGLSVTVVDHKTGRTLAQLNPVPQVDNWSLWRADLKGDIPPSVDVIAKDDGASWGSWLAVGLPMQLPESRH